MKNNKKDTFGGAVSAVYPYYGLAGKYIKVKLKQSWDTATYNNVWLPCYVVSEYPKFIRVEVQPHINPNDSFGESKPYMMSISKAAITFNEVNIKGW